MKLTKEQIAEIAARLEGTTPGPWEHGRMYYPSDGGRGSCDISQEGEMGIHATAILPPKERSAFSEGPANAKLMTHCRMDVPRLLAHITEQDNEISAKDDALKQALSGFEYLPDRINCTAYIRAIKEALNPPNKTTP